MEFKYLDENRKHDLIDHFYRLKISELDLPFESLIIPIGQTNITYVFCEDFQIYKLKDKRILCKDLILTGQIYGSYHLEVNNISESIGFGLKPTALYKILNKDISKFNNQHLPLKNVSMELHNIFKSAFIDYKNNEEAFVNSIYKIFENLTLTKDSNIKHIDKAIDYIQEKEGLLQVNDLLKIIPMSQKSLEIQFKKIVGITPGKYIRQSRFIKLMQKYVRQEFEIKDLMYMFEYYDESHFSKDFKYFLGETPKNFFKKDYPLIQKYLK